MNCKAPETYRIAAELLNKEGNVVWRRLHNLTRMIWKEEGSLPEEKSFEIVQPIFKKKEEKREWSNYNGEGCTLQNL